MSTTVEISTIGFTKKNARKFFDLLKRSGAKRLIDVRLNNVSQLAGFAKKDDLAFFAKEICDVDYVHMPMLAPTQEMLDTYKKHGGDWTEYEKRFLGLMEARKIEDRLAPDQITHGCLLCSEDTPHHCHRRLVAEYLNDRWGNVAIKHLT
jgi:uncharacterized protein (DUF488 family)